MNKEQFIKNFGKELYHEYTINISELEKAGVKNEIIPIADRGFDEHEETETILVKLDEGIIKFNGNFVHFSYEEGVFTCFEYDSDDELKKISVYTLEEIRNLTNIDYGSALTKAQKTLDKLA